MTTILVLETDETDAETALFEIAPADNTATIARKLAGTAGVQLDCGDIEQRAYWVSRALAWLLEDDNDNA